MVPKAKVELQVYPAKEVSQEVQARGEYKDLQVYSLVYVLETVNNSRLGMQGFTGPPGQTGTPGAKGMTGGPGPKGSWTWGDQLC